MLRQKITGAAKKPSPKPRNADSSSLRVAAAAAAGPRTAPPIGRERHGRPHLSLAMDRQMVPLPLAGRASPRVPTTSSGKRLRVVAWMPLLRPRASPSGGATTELVAWCGDVARRGLREPPRPPVSAVPRAARASPNFLSAGAAFVRDSCFCRLRLFHRLWGLASGEAW